jgi:hypothetical protein
MENNKPLHFNKPQILSMLIGAHEEYDIWGRATGKSEGLLAPRVQKYAHSMPRSSGAKVGSTYQQLLTRTLPPLVSGLERMGYKKDFHYFIGKKPPKSWNWPEPYVAPISYDYYFQWYTGAGAHLVSQDRPGSSNGLSVDWIMGDEAKLLNKAKLDSELLPTNRGNRQYFGHLPEHHSLLFCSDMPTSASGKWLLDKREEMDQEQIDLILGIQIKIMQIQNDLQKATVAQQKKMMAAIRSYEKELTTLRFGSVYYSEFSTLENIGALGIDFIKQMRRILPDIVFRASILGERITKVEDGFYSHLDENIHCYDRFDYSFLDGLDYDFSKLSIPDCRMDADLDRYRPLEIACDYGASINVVVVGQEHGDEFRFSNAMHVKHPDRLLDLATRFCDYYTHFPTKYVNYYYDHTAVGTDAMRTTTFSDEFASVLRQRGWHVNMLYIGQAPSHHSKYLLWGRALKGDDRLPKPRFNKTNCKYLLLSMDQAEVIQGRNGFEKNKKDERNKNIPQEETTHYSDAADSLYFSKYATKIKEEPEFFDTMIG